MVQPVHWGLISATARLVGRIEMTSNRVPGGVGDWSMRWNAKSDARKLGPGIPKSDFWASAKETIDQVGCVYTAQGFEFDYVGVIFGPDLVYRPMDRGWVGQRDQSHDRVVRSGVTEKQFTDFVKSTYRVLLTRGLRGCYVYFMDTPTRGLFLSRTKRSSVLATRAAESNPLCGGDA